MNHRTFPMVCRVMFCRSLALLLLSMVHMMLTSLPPPPTNFRKVEKKILDELFSPSVYDSATRPKGFSENNTEEDGPTKVLVNVFVRSFEKIDDVKMEYSFQITLRQQWNDIRLAFNDMGGRIKYLTMTDRGKVTRFMNKSKTLNSHPI